VPLDPGEMLALASMLNGKPVAYRQREMFSHGGDGANAAHLYYETPEQARSWIDDIAAADGAEGDPVRTALYRFARIVFAHPLTDANGRFARAALQAGLARGGVIATPCLALAPVFHIHPAAMGAAAAGLSRTGCWVEYFDRVGSVLANALTWIATQVAAPQ
jgi:Fic family protein